ncbi:MAG: hypothetical protein DWH79_01240 [Planctomycetota bacterium]|nr:MAG: hypothetical protein DWH79_01240 [Planctomycetota bacterium]
MPAASHAIPGATYRSRVTAEDLLPRGSRGGVGRIWVPWLLAPMFTLMPIAGCTLAGKVRQASLLPTNQAPAVPPEVPKVTFDPQAAPVVPIVPVTRSPGRP